MAAVMPPDERVLPAPEQLELAEYQLGVYLSELDDIQRTVRHEMNPRYEQHLAARAVGVELSESELDRVALLELLCFATDAIIGADTIRKTATKIQYDVLGELREQRNPSGHDDPAWTAYKERVRDWHREHVESWNGGGDA